MNDNIYVFNRLNGEYMYRATLGNNDKIIPLRDDMFIWKAIDGMYVMTVRNSRFIRCKIIGTTSTMFVKTHYGNGLCHIIDDKHTDHGMRRYHYLALLTKINLEIGYAFTFTCITPILNETHIKIETSVIQTFKYELIGYRTNGKLNICRSRSYKEISYRDVIIESFNKPCINEDITFETENELLTSFKCDASYPIEFTTFLSPTISSFNERETVIFNMYNIHDNGELSLQLDVVSLESTGSTYNLFSAICAMNTEYVIGQVVNCSFSIYDRTLRSTIKYECCRDLQMLSTKYNTIYFVTDKLCDNNRPLILRLMFP
jgi:hypothetical protein